MSDEKKTPIKDGIEAVKDAAGSIPDVPGAVLKKVDEGVEALVEFMKDFEQANA